MAARPGAADQAQGRELRQHRARLGAARAGRHAGLRRRQRRWRGEPGEACRQGVRPRRHAVEVPLPRVLAHQGRRRAAGLLARPRRPAAGRRQHVAQQARHLRLGSGSTTARPCSPAICRTISRATSPTSAAAGAISRGRCCSRAGDRSIDLIDAEHLALDAARANITDPRASFHWLDLTREPAPATYDAIVCNPPFHTGRASTPALGQSDDRSRGARAEAAAAASTWSPIAACPTSRC